MSKTQKNPSFFTKILSKSNVWLVVIFLIVILVIGALGWLIFIFPSSQGEKSLDSDTATLASNKIQLPLDKIEIANTNETRQKGLMNREFLCDRCGMLFDFEKEDWVDFWMKDTPLSLDIIFIKKSGQITSIAKSTEPNNDTKLYNSKKAVQYVLEVNSGFADKNGLKEGQYLDVEWLKGKN